MNDRNRSVIEEFRANAGKVSGPFDGSPLLLLSTTGAKTGTSYTTPLLYLSDGDRFVIFASKGGAPTSPNWYHNLVANPNVTIEVGAESVAVLAKVTQSEERDRLYATQSERFPQFGEYQANTSRTISVVALERKG